MDIKQKNRDLEFDTKDFTIVPENLFTNGSIGGVKKRIFAVRLKPEGLRKIAERDKKAGIDFDVVEVRGNNDENYLYIPSFNTYSNLKEIRETMDRNKDGKMKGMIVIATNKNGRLQHAMSFVYGKVNGKNNVLFTFDQDKELLKKYITNNGYNIYSMGYPELNNDAHSCAVGALVNVEKMLKNSAKYAKEIIEQRITKNDKHQFNHEISTYFQNSKALENRYINRIFFEKQLLFNNKKNHYDNGKMFYLYNENDDVLSKNDQNNKPKNINTKLAWKGKEYLRRIMKEDELSTNSINTNYNADDYHFLIDEYQIGKINKQYKTYSEKKDISKNNQQSGYYNAHEHEQGGCCPGGCNIF